MLTFHPLKVRFQPLSDLQIAVIALANNLTLVTHNIREFSWVEGLRIEDWEADGSAKLV